jgi:hypothetical protein
VVLVWFVLGVVLGLPGALPVAVFAGISTFVPNIGIILPLIPIIIFTVAFDPSQLLVMVMAYLTIQFIESNILTPYIVKSELHIPAGAVLLFQIIVISLFGPLGLVVAVPMLAVIITLVREVYSYDVLGLREIHEIMVLKSPAEAIMAIDQNQSGQSQVVENQAAPREPVPEGASKSTSQRPVHQAGTVATPPSQLPEQVSSD